MDAKCPKCDSEAIEWREHDSSWICADCEYEWKGPAPAAYEQDDGNGDNGGGDGD